ncbi:unnamed protein product [Amoebophrya sp. A25]|nr:unnamed protein product [Amoebophrya sp. A25]|eukprot:GSA25T00014501001.1
MTIKMLFASHQHSLSLLDSSAEAQHDGDAASFLHSAKVPSPSLLGEVNANLSGSRTSMDSRTSRSRITAFIFGLGDPPAPPPAPPKPPEPPLSAIVLKEAMEKIEKGQKLPEEIATDAAAQVISQSAKLVGSAAEVANSAAALTTAKKSEVILQRPHKGSSSSVYGPFDKPPGFFQGQGGGGGNSGARSQGGGQRNGRA